MKLIGSTSTVSFIPDGNLYLRIIEFKEFCSLRFFGPLISSLTRYFLFNLNIGALTGPKIFPDILFCKIDLNFIDRFGPDGISSLIKIISSIAVKFQNGFIYHYAFVMLLGFSALLTFLILK